MRQIAVEVIAVVKRLHEYVSYILYIYYSYFSVPLSLLVSELRGSEMSPTVNTEGAHVPLSGRYHRRVCPYREQVYTQIAKVQPCAMLPSRAG